MNEFKTFLGQTVKAGDYITYPGRQGSSVWMNVSKVLEVTTMTYWGGSKTIPVLKVQKISTNGYYRDKKFKPSTLTALGNVVKLSQWDVVTVDDYLKILS